MKGFILAGGKGTRLRPVTYEIPKPLIPVGGQEILTYLINFYAESGIEDIKINIPAKHKRKFLKWRLKNFPDKKISFLVEKTASGTMGPLIKSLNWFDDDVLISNGDELKSFAVEEMIEQHRKKEQLATIALTEVDNPSSYGVAITKGSKIIKFLEKPNNPPSSYISSGIYILSPEVKKYFPDKEFSMLEKDLFPKLAERRELSGYKSQGSWYDTGTLERWGKAIKQWKS